MDHDLAKPFSRVQSWLLGYGVLAAVALFQFYKESQKGEPSYVVLVAIFAAAAVLFYYSLRKQLDGYATRVIDRGSILEVQVGPHTAHVPLADITDIASNKMFRTITVFVSLRKPAPFGDWFRFSACSDIVVEELRRKLPTETSSHAV